MLYFLGRFRPPLDPCPEVGLVVISMYRLHYNLMSWWNRAERLVVAFSVAWAQVRANCMAYKCPMDPGIAR